MASAPDVSASDSLTPSKQETSWSALWRTVTLVEREKIVYGRSIRNAVGVAVPLAAGYWLGSLPAGLIVASGALNVCFTDGDDPYRQRSRRMLLGTFLVGLAVLIGTLTGGTPILSIAVAGAWAFVAGMMVAVSQPATDMGVVTLVTLLVFSAQPMQPHQAETAGLLAMLGGLVQTGLALAFWPVQKHEPERRALANLYSALAQAAESPASAGEAPVASTQVIDANNTLASLVAIHTVEADRYRSLLNQAERMRLSLLALARLRARIGREPDALEETATLDQFFERYAQVLASIAASLRTKKPLDAHPGDLSQGDLSQIDALSEALRARQKSAPSELLCAFLRDARYQVDALAGQIRSAVELAAHATPEGLEEFERTQSQTPWTLRLRGSFATLRANLTFESAAFRHAVRLAVVSPSPPELAERALSWHRTYWLPMTVAIVLKPDFTATFSRGLLRVAGTLAGLALATGLFHVVSTTVLTQIILIGILTFILRSYGAANYGILTAAVSGLVVLLIGLTGVSAKDVVPGSRSQFRCRGSTRPRRLLAVAQLGAGHRVKRNTWPASSTRIATISRPSSKLISRIPHPALPPWIWTSARQAARLARSNLTASVDRLTAEPYKFRVIALNDMLASSHRLVHALMALGSRPLPKQIRASPRRVPHV